MFSTAFLAWTATYWWRLSLTFLRWPCMHDSAAASLCTTRHCTSTVQSIKTNHRLPHPSTWRLLSRKSSLLPVVFCSSGRFLMIFGSETNWAGSFSSRVYFDLGLILAKIYIFNITRIGFRQDDVLYKTITKYNHETVLCHCQLCLITCHNYVWIRNW